MNQPFRILSIDGGGIRGVYAVCLLADFEKKLSSSIHNYFDLIVGTSTGGIIALGLVMGIPASEIHRFYKEDIPKIFKKTWRSIQGGFLLPKYSNAPLVESIKNVFGNLTLKSAKCKVCIPAVNGSEGKNVVFKTKHKPEYVNDEKFKVWELAMATSSAPYYFPAFRAKNTSFIDGGIWANNPMLVGISEAKKLGHLTDDIKILSLGTGNMKFKRAPWKLNYGLAISWGPKLLDLFFNAHAQSVENEARYLISDKNLIRVTFPIPNEAELDDLNYLPILEKKAMDDKDKVFELAKTSFFLKHAPPFTPLP